MPELQFIHLNKGWNAHPNAPSVDVHFHGTTAELRFLLNPFLFEAEPGEVAALRFGNCSRWHWGHTNDHAWYSGSGRYAKQAPKWGEFYEVVGEEILGGDAHWEIISSDPANARHFLFYFRDEALEFIACDWSIYRNRLTLQ